MSSITDWLKHDSMGLADEIVSINASIKDGVSGFGMKVKVIELLDKLKRVLFPTLYDADISDERYLHARVMSAVGESAVLLDSLTRSVFVNTCELNREAGCDECASRADRITLDFMNSLADIRRVLQTDIEAAYLGDPAARGSEEILLSYPSVEAVSTYRMAHALFERGVPLIPRIMTEHAHSSTGIDIHPGAVIGDHFFIDHGTGVVIGETCVIGSHVKLYQGVTLGAKSFELDDDGNPVKGVKRHPNIEDHVIIYAGATILGGDTVIGHHSVVGGNVWLTHSVPPHSTVYNSDR